MDWRCCINKSWLNKVTFFAKLIMHSKKYYGDSIAFAVFNVAVGRFKCNPLEILVICDKDRKYIWVTGEKETDLCRRTSSSGKPPS